MEAGVVNLRPFAEPDLDALYEISLLTGNLGGDATALHREPRLIEEIYSAPYARLEPSWAFVAEDEHGVGGYIVGAPDTRAFEARLEAEWWPSLRRDHADPSGASESWTPDEVRAWLIHHPRPAPADIVERYPAHLHMNLHPRLQGRRVGGRLLDLWLSAAVVAGLAGIHLGASPGNQRAVDYWGRSGFVRLVRPGAKPRSTVWFGRTL
jgi:ribosomal protein S18 acetylase RimI-like enzyme